LANIALRDGATADIGRVVMDEFHFYGDPDRGWAWQVPLLELPVHSRATIATVPDGKLDPAWGRRHLSP
jgi:superfamily II RNA helicase